MEFNTTRERQEAHALLDLLPDYKLNAVRSLLEVMVPHDEDGDTLSDSEHKAIAEAEEWLKHNEPIAHEQVLAEFGLTTADWGKMTDETVPDESARRR